MAKPPEDDWFPQTEASPAADAPGRPVEDEWLLPAGAPPRPPGVDLWAFANRQILIPAALALVFLVGLLAALGAFDSALPPVTVPGYTAPTVAVTKPPGSGTTTTATTTAGTTTTSQKPSVVPPTTTLKPGDNGAEVKTLQRELATLGFSVGRVDGFYGQATKKAVAAFQRAHHLTADGIVGSATLAALAP